MHLHQNSDAGLQQSERHRRSRHRNLQGGRQGGGDADYGTHHSAAANDIGSDTGTPVDDRDYQVPFKFTGKIAKLAIKVEPPVLTEQDKRKLAEAQRLARDGK